MPVDTPVGMYMQLKSLKAVKQHQWTIGFRLLGIIPLIFFLLRLRYFISIGEWCYILWICHVSNLVLSAGLLLALPVLIRVSVLWLIVGVPLWVGDMTLTGIRTFSTFGTHIGGLAIGLFAFSRVRGDRISWAYAMAIFFFIQAVCRYITPVETNVNIARTIYSGWEMMFTAYWKYWIVTSLCAVIVLWVVSAVLANLFPPVKKISNVPA